MWSASFDSPVGRLHALGSDRGLRAVSWSAGEVHRLGPDATPVAGVGPALLAELREQLEAYFEGDLREIELRLDPIGTEFQRAAWTALIEIPFGETRSYAQQAEAIGRPSAVRAIGTANGANPVVIVIPCHRVIGADGSLTGFGGGLPLKRKLLEHEARIAGTPGPRGSELLQPQLPFSGDEIRPGLRHRE